MPSRAPLLVSSGVALPPPGPISQADARRVPTASRPANPDWTSRIGFWSGLLAAGVSVVFSIASVPVLLGFVGPPWDNVPTLVPSLLLAPALLVLLVCVDAASSEEDRIWSRLGVAFAGIYVALVSVVYVVELAVVEPLIVSGHAGRAGLLTIDPGGTLNAVDGLGYTFLGFALLWLAPVFHGTRLKRWTRWSLVANGIAIVPIVLTYFVDRAFIAITGPLWAIAVPASSLVLAVSFRPLNGASRVRSG
jgi:hypothetical protein